MGLTHKVGQVKEGKLLDLVGLYKTVAIQTKTITQNLDIRTVPQNGVVTLLQLVVILNPTIRA
jgi:hypothetical protein